MSTLQIRKKSLKTWVHVDSVLGEFIISKFYFNADDNEFQIVEQGQSKRFKYSILNITLFDDTAGGVAEYFTSIEQLSLRLEVLKYPAFYVDGEIVVSGIEDVIAGTNITIDKTDPQNPIINATGSGSSLIIYESGETPIVDINEIEVIGATVTDDGGGKVTLEVTGGSGTPTLQEVTDVGNTVTDGTSTTTIGQGTIEIDNDEIECMLFYNNGDVTGIIINSSSGVAYETANASTSEVTFYRNGDINYKPNVSDPPITLNIPYTDETDGNTFATREWAVANIYNVLPDKLLLGKTGWSMPTAIQSPNSFKDLGFSSSTTTGFLMQGNHALSGEIGRVGFTTGTTGDLCFRRSNNAYSFQNTICTIYNIFRFVTIESEHRFVFGFSKNYQFATPSNISPTAETNFVGICKMESSSNLHFLWNDATGTANTEDSGYPCLNSANELYYIIAKQLTSSYEVTIVRYNFITNLEISRVTKVMSSDIPDRTSGGIQTVHWGTKNGATSHLVYADGGFMFDIKN